MRMTTYRCVHCKKKVERHSDKHWINSYCEEMGKITRLIKETTHHFDKFLGVQSTNNKQGYFNKRNNSVMIDYLESGLTQKQISEKYGISKTRVRQIIDKANRLWKPNIFEKK